MFERDSIVAKEHPIISKFVKELEETVGDGVLSFSNLQKKNFMPFWKYLIIAKFVQEKKDFEMVLFGTSMVNAYLNDQTGRLLSEMDLGKWEEQVRQLHLDVLFNVQRIYSSGNFGWLKNDFTRWNQVKVPLKRDDKVEETLTCVCFG